MTFIVFCILLFTALLHANWNAIVKASGDKMYAATGVGGSAALIALVMPPSAPQPALVGASYLLVSCVLQAMCTVLVAETYQVSDISQTYPPMRGIAPLLVVVISVILLGDRLSPLAWLGIGVICLAILMMTFHDRVSSRKGIVLALINTYSIASYTLMDGIGVRLAGSALDYTLWTSFMNGFYLLCWVTMARRRGASRYLYQHQKKDILGGADTTSPYDLMLWVVTQAPLTVVAALRETSILFGALIAFIALKGQLTPLRIMATCGITARTIPLRLA